MRNHLINRHRAIGILISGVLLSAAMAGGISPSAAQDRPSGPMDHGGIIGGIGAGLAIGIGGALLQQAITSHDSGDRPPGGSKKAAVRSSGGGGGGASAGGGNGRSGVPPRGEQRFVADEIIVEFVPGVSAQTIDQIARRYNLTLLDSQSLPLIATALYRWRIAGRRSAADVIGAIENERAVASAQPNYIFALQEQNVAPTATADAGDPAQYVLSKLQINEAHQLATGKNVVVALIDSQIDAQHPDFAGAMVKSFDALGQSTPPHKHGTAIAGAITAHGKLLGIAPGAQLLAICAFDDSAEAKGTSSAIYKGLQWAVDNNARVVNMSFAGPLDPDLRRLLAAAYAKDVVLVAAAGNAGPNAPPLYPAADVSVIAVTATDSDDAMFKMASRGDYVAMAAPGVDILAASPEASYQQTTGTSIAAAHASGAVALLLERKQTLKPKDVRAVLTKSAKPLGIGGHAEAGAGLINAYQALLALGGPAVGGDDGGERR